MFVAVTVLLPKEMVDSLPDSENISIESDFVVKNGKRYYQNSATIANTAHKDATKKAFKFVPRLLGGRTPSQLFGAVEEQEKSLNEMLSFDVVKSSTTKASHQNKTQIQKVSHNKQTLNGSNQGKTQTTVKTSAAQADGAKSGKTKNFIPRLFGGRTTSQLFNDAEDEQKILNEMLAFDIVKGPETKAKASHQAKTLQKVSHTSQPSHGSNHQSKKGEIVKTTSISNTAQKNAPNKAEKFVPKFFGGKTPSQLFDESEELQKSFSQMLSFGVVKSSDPKGKTSSQTNKNILRTDHTREASNSSRHIMKPTKAGDSFQATAAKPDSVQKIPNKNSATANISKRTAAAPRPDFVQKSTNKDSAKAHTALTTSAKIAAKFVPKLFGGKTPSQLFLDGEELQKSLSQMLSFDVDRSYKTNALYRIKKPAHTTGHARQTSNSSNQQPKASRIRKQDKKDRIGKTANRPVSHDKKTTGRNISAYGTTGEHGHLTPSRLLNPYRIKRERYYTLGKGRMTPSRLYLAYRKQHKFRPNLFGAQTASQLLTSTERQADREQNDQQVSLLSGFPTVSQLVLNQKLSEKEESTKKAEENVEGYKVPPVLYGFGFLYCTFMLLMESLDD